MHTSTSVGNTPRMIGRSPVLVKRLVQHDGRSVGVVCTTAPINVGACLAWVLLSFLLITNVRSK